MKDTSLRIKLKKKNIIYFNYRKLFLLMNRLKIKIIIE